MGDQGIYTELALLRRGAGLRAPDLLSRVGPTLAAFAGIQRDDSPGIARAKLVDSLTSVVSRLDGEARISAQAALALSPGPQNRFLRERMERLGESLDRDPRTAIRRVENALTLMGEIISAELERRQSGEIPPGSWQYSTHRSTLLVSVKAISIVEVSRIVATKGEVKSLPLSWDLSGVVPNTLRHLVDVFNLTPGFVSREAFTDQSMWFGRFDLQEPLTEGEERDVSFLISLPFSSSLHRPYFTFTPQRRCGLYTVQANFHAPRAAINLWPLMTVPRDTSVFSALDRRPGQSVLSEQVSFRYDEPQVNFAYGLAWSGINDVVYDRDRDFYSRRLESPPGHIVDRSGRSQEPAAAETSPGHLFDEIVSDLRLLREKGTLRLRYLDLPALETSARTIYGLTADENVSPAAVEQLLRRAIHELGGDELGIAAQYLFGLVQGTIGRRPTDLRERAATVFGVSAETFRKDREKLIIARIAEEIVRLTQTNAIPPA